MTNLQHSDYITTATEEIRNNMTKLGAGSGFTNDFFVANVSKDDIQRDIFKSFERLFDNEDEESTANFENTLYGRFIEYGTSNGNKITEGVSGNIRKLAAFCGQIYSSYTSIPCYAQIRSLIQMEKNFINTYLLIGVILLLFILIILFLINLENLCELAKLLITILAGTCLSSFLILVASKIFYINGNFSISNLIFKNLAEKCYSGIEHEFLMIFINFCFLLIFFAACYIHLVENIQLESGKKRVVYS